MNWPYRYCEVDLHTIFELNDEWHISYTVVKFGSRVDSRKYIAATHKAKADRLSASLVVFLGGPYINPHDPATATSDEAKARLYLFNKILEEYGVTPSIGEHNLMRNVGTAKFDKANNAHLYELDFVRNLSNCVILIPSSPGSFCELGVFADYQSICNKMIIIIDKKYKEHKQSYINLGPVPMAKKQGAKVSFMDLKKNSYLWRVVKDHIEDRMSWALHQALKD